jgi:hypothetical protein
VTGTRRQHRRHGGRMKRRLEDPGLSRPGSQMGNVQRILFRLDNLDTLDSIATRDAIHHVHTFYDLPKHSIAAVEMRLR